MSPDHGPTNGAPDAPTPDDRDAYGRFTKGNKGGPGNPHARQTAALRQEVSNYMAEGNLRPLVERLYARAMHDDNAAARLLLQYSLGRPATAVEPDELDVHELLLHRRSMATMADEASLKPSVYAARTVNTLTNILRPVLHEMHMAECGQTLTEDDDPAEDQPATPEDKPAAAPADPLFAAGLSLSVEETSELLRHPLLRDLDRQAKQRDGRRDGSRSDAHRGPNADSQRPRSDRAANPPRDDQPPTNGR